ncbi:hypothetical protein HUJ04_008082 [Dendroctonus ponderosae]|nr:hypothetical protein HUJ04_008082 [Dendroctonus ponderosae]
MMGVDYLQAEMSSFNGLLAMPQHQSCCLLLFLSLCIAHVAGKCVVTFTETTGAIICRNITAEDYVAELFGITINIPEIKVTWELFQSNYDTLKIVDGELYDIMIEGVVSEEALLSEMERCEEYTKTYLRLHIRYIEVTKSGELQSVNSSVEQNLSVSFLQIRATRLYTLLPKLMYSTAVSKKNSTKSPISEEPTKFGSVTREKALGRN